MATLAQSLSPQGASRWFWEFLKDELAPYPGRAGTVCRMVISATLIMIICMAFHIPYGWQGAIYAVLVSRESPRATVQSAGTIFVLTAVTAVYLLASVWAVISIPGVHFLWVIGTLFIAFYAISTLTNYTAAVAIVNTISLGIPLWDRHVPAETNVGDILWLCWLVFLSVGVTVGVELIFASAEDEVVLQIEDRLSAVQRLLNFYADGRAPDPVVEQTIIRLEMLGTSLMRRILRRSQYSSRYLVEMGGVVNLVGRLIDLAATLTQIKFEWSSGEQRQFRDLASNIASIRDAVVDHRIPSPVQFDSDEQSGSIPFLGEMKHTVTLIPQAFADSRSVHQGLTVADYLPQTPLVPDAFVNPEHVRFAVKGCLAASSCYVLYNAIDWPGISTSVTTCLLTALTTVGTSRQKQVLRITGAIVGGFILGIGSQMFILPNVDSITGFTVLFVSVMVLSSWFMTSSPRLSYFGVQVALAFCLIHVNEFKIQTSLAVARDRVVGILVGLTLMWFVFDQLWSAPAAVAMRSTIVSNLRLLAQFAREPLSKDPKTAISQCLALRETISSKLDQVRAQADGVLFEFGSSRKQDIALRNRIRKWQPQLRMVFIIRVVLWKYRMHFPGFELPEQIATDQRRFDDHWAQALDFLADRIEGKVSGELPSLKEPLTRLAESVRSGLSPESQEKLAVRLGTFLSLNQRVEGLMLSLDEQV